MTETAPENQYCADAIHEGFDALLRAAELLGDPLENVEHHRTVFWTGILQLTAPAGRA